MISAFGVEHGDEFAKRERDPSRGNKSFGDPGKTAAVVGGAGAILIGRKRGNAVGTVVGQRLAGRSKWSAERAAHMQPGKLARTREKWAGKVGTTARRVGGNEDLKEWAGRGLVGVGAGGAAGGVVYGRKKLTPVEGKRKS